MLYDWIAGRAPPPPEQDSDVLRLIHELPLRAAARVTELDRYLRPPHRAGGRLAIFGAPEGHDAFVLGGLVARGAVPVAAPCLPRRRPHGAHARGARLLPSRRSRC